MIWSIKIQYNTTRIVTSQLSLQYFNMKCVYHSNISSAVLSNDVAQTKQELLMGITLLGGCGWP